MCIVCCSVHCLDEQGSVHCEQGSVHCLDEQGSVHCLDVAVCIVAVCIV